MTIQEAESLAANLAQRMRLARRLDGAEVLVVDYTDQGTLTYLNPEQPENTLTDHRMVNKAMAKLVQRRGGHVTPVTINVSDYFAWLGKFSLSDSHARRSQYLAWLTTPEPRMAPE